MKYLMLTRAGQFREARAVNLGLLRSLEAAQWSRAGTQEGVGRVALCDMPHVMAEHDDAHRAEIDAWAAGPSGGVDRTG